MFFDLGWPELLVIGVVALIVIGPKELPSALRAIGSWVRKARTLSREFQGSVEQMLREAELDEIRKDLKNAANFDLEREFQQSVDPNGELAESIKPPHLPDYFNETPPPTAASEGSPVVTAPPRMIGFEEPEPAEPEPQPTQPPAEPAASTP